MNVRKSKMLVFSMSFVVLATANSGCNSLNDEQTTTEPVVSQPSASQAKNKSEQEKAQLRTITEIWEARKQESHEELISKVDLLLSPGDCDEDTTATMLFLKADSLRQLGGFEEATTLFTLLVDKYSYAWWTDPRYKTIYIKGLCEIGLRLVSEKDRSAFPESSQYYTQRAWDYLRMKRFETALHLAEVCIARFEGQAIKQQEKWSQEQTPPEYVPDPEKNTELHGQFWALNDVGTCSFICGQAYEKMADSLKREPGNSVSEKCIKHYAAIECFNEVINKYPGAWCFDPRGPWYWSVRQGSERRNDIVVSQKLAGYCDRDECRKILLDREKRQEAQSKSPK